MESEEEKNIRQNNYARDKVIKRLIKQVEEQMEKNRNKREQLIEQATGNHLRWYLKRV